MPVVVKVLTHFWASIVTQKSSALERYLQSSVHLPELSHVALQPIEDHPSWLGLVCIWIGWSSSALFTLGHQRPRNLLRE